VLRTDDDRLADLASRLRPHRVDAAVGLHAGHVGQPRRPAVLAAAGEDLGVVDTDAVDADAHLAGLRLGPRHRHRTEDVDPAVAREAHGAHRHTHASRV